MLDTYTFKLLILDVLMKIKPQKQCYQKLNMLISLKTNKLRLKVLLLLEDKVKRNLFSNPSLSHFRISLDKRWQK
jgi:hypothetical protein